MLRKLFLLTLALTLRSQQAYSQWEATLKSIYVGRYNTLLYLNYQPTDTISRQYKVEISFRYPLDHRVIHAKEFYIETDQPKLYTYQFDLPPYEYEVDIDLVNIANQSAINIPRSYQCRYKPGELSISDIFLAYNSANRFDQLSPLLQPIPTLDTSHQTIFFYLEIYAPGYNQIPAEAILFTHKSHQQPQSIRYISLQKKEDVMDVANGRAVFTGSFDLSTLDVGSYRILINLKGNESVNSIANFELKGNTQTRIYKNIDKAIQMMEYILPQSSIQDILRIADPVRRKDSLIRTWDKLFPNNSEQPFRTENAMEQYYSKLFSFVDDIAYEGENWTSARAKIYIMYGEPDNGWDDIKPFQMNGKTFERWTYSRYNLAFTFVRRNNRYVLVE